MDVAKTKQNTSHSQSEACWTGIGLNAQAHEPLYGTDDVTWSYWGPKRGKVCISPDFMFCKIFSNLISPYFSLWPLLIFKEVSLLSVLGCFICLLLPSFSSLLIWRPGAGNGLAGHCTHSKKQCWRARASHMIQSWDTAIVASYHPKAACLPFPRQEESKGEAMELRPSQPSRSPWPEIVMLATMVICVTNLAFCWFWAFNEFRFFVLFFFFQLIAELTELWIKLKVKPPQITSLSLPSWELSFSGVSILVPQEVIRDRTYPSWRLVPWVGALLSHLSVTHSESTHTYLFSTYYLPCAGLGTGDIKMSKTELALVPTRLTCQCGYQETPRDLL